MGLIETKKQPRVFLNLSAGKITHKEEDGTITAHAGIEGTLEDITEHQAIFNGNPLDYADFHLHDEGIDYVLGIPKSKGAFRGLVFSLVSDKDIKGKRVTITPYLKDKYTNVSVAVDGEKVKWPENLKLPQEKYKREEYVMRAFDKLKSYMATPAEAVQQQPQTREPDPVPIEYEEDAAW